MTIQKNTILLAGYLFLLFTSCSSPSNTSNEAKDLDNKEYNNLLEASLNKGFPGIILGVQKGDETWIGAAGYSNIEQKNPMLKSDRFHLASVTKLFISVAVLKLIDEGKLKIDSKAIEHLDPSLVAPIPFMEKIEIGQLLDHSSGIYSINNDMEYIETLIGKRAFDNVNWSTSELITLAYGSRVDPEGEPGTGHYYSDTNLILLGRIIENISKKPLRHYIKETLLNPLGLENTGFYSEVDDPSKVEVTPTVQGYLKRSKELDSFITLHEGFQEVSPGLINTTMGAEKIDAAAGMVSTAEDLLKFGRAVYSGDVISSESLNWLLSIGEGIENESIGTKRQGIVSVHHKEFGVFYTSLGDGAGGINTMLAYHPKSSAIIVAFTNIFGNFDEHDFFMDEIAPKMIDGLSEE